MAKFEFTANTRSESGSAHARKLRREEKIPGIMYGSEISPQTISMSHHEMFQLLRNEEFQSSILDMNLDGTKHQVLLRNVQFHPYKSKLVHMDFQQVSDKKEIRKLVPLHFTNTNESPGIKLNGGVASHTVIEIEITCLPKDLPTHINVDMGKLEVGQSIHASELDLPSGVKLVLSAKENPMICGVLAPRKEEATATAESAVAAPAEAKAADAKAPAKPADKK